MKNNLVNDLNLYKPDDWCNGHCPYCHGEDNRCSQTDDGAFAICYKNFKGALKVKEGMIGTYGTYLLNQEALNRKRQASPWAGKSLTSTATYKTHIPKTTSDISADLEKLLDDAHREFINNWDLSLEHQNYLLGRGFTSKQIERQLYRTSRHTYEVIDDMTRKFGPDLLKVPGVVQILGKYQFRSDGQLVIPTINQLNHIVNFRVRLTGPNVDPKKRYIYVSSNSKNNPGLKTYMSAHVVIPEVIKDKRIWITEGEFKAHYASEKLGARFISVPGVGMWELALPVLEHFNNENIVLAYDQDMWTKRNVATQLINFFYELKERSYEPVIAKW